MADTMTVRMAQQGVVVLPEALLEHYNLRSGATLTLFDLDGVFVLSPRRSEIDTIAGRLTEALTERGETLETMLRSLREERDSGAS